MREIEFRAWNKKHKQMLYNAELATVDIREKPELMEKCNGFEITTFFHIAPHDQNIVLMQYTGLKDKNGKEIYEGDVVEGTVNFPQLLTGDTDANSNFKMCGIVEYNYSGYILRCVQSRCDKDREGMVNWFDFMGNEGEIFDEKAVIGNIYENPELLK